MTKLDDATVSAAWAMAAVYLRGEGEDMQSHPATAWATAFADAVRTIRQAEVAMRTPVSIVLTDSREKRFATLSLSHDGKDYFLE